MKLVVLDGDTLNPGDLDWKGIEQFGDLVVYDRTKFDAEAIIENIGDAEAIFTNKTPLPKEVLSRVPHVKYIGVLATGYDNIDIDTAKTMDMVVANVPGYGTKSVAQFAMALLLEMCHHVGDHSKAVKEGQWTKSLDFCFWNKPLIELDDKTMGIIGFGEIGQTTAKLAQAFGLNILVYSRTVKPELETETCKFVELDDLLKRSDIISLHCPLTEETEGIINKESIAKMKDGVMIINTSRGGLIVEDHLKNALNTDKIAGAAVDVVSTEPIKADNPLLQAKNCIITPHIAWAPKESRQRMMQTTIENLRAYLDGNPINVVNG